MQLAHDQHLVNLQIYLSITRIFNSPEISDFFQNEGSHLTSHNTFFKERIYLPRNKNNYRVGELTINWN